MTRVVCSWGDDIPIGTGDLSTIYPDSDSAGVRLLEFSDETSNKSVNTQGRIWK